MNSGFYKNKRCKCAAKAAPEPLGLSPRLRYALLHDPEDIYDIPNDNILSRHDSRKPLSAKAYLLSRIDAARKAERNRIFLPDTYNADGHD